MLTIGQVLVSGGANFATHKFTELASAELYPPDGQVRSARRRPQHLTPIPRPACHGPNPLPSGVGRRDGSPLGCALHAGAAGGLPVVLHSRR